MVRHVAIMANNTINLSRITLYTAHQHEQLVSTPKQNVVLAMFRTQASAIVNEAKIRISSKFMPDDVQSSLPPNHRTED